MGWLITNVIHTSRWYITHHADKLYSTRWRIIQHTKTHTAHADTWCSTRWHMRHTKTQRHTLTHDTGVTARADTCGTRRHMAHADTWYSTLTHTAHADTCGTRRHIRHTLTRDSAHADTCGTRRHRHKLTHDTDVTARADTCGTRRHMVHADTWYRCYSTSWHLRHTKTHAAHEDIYGTRRHIRHALARDAAHAHTCGTRRHMAHTDTWYSTRWHMRHTKTHTAHADTCGTRWHMIRYTDTHSTVSAYKSSNYLLLYSMYYLTFLRFEAWNSSRQYTSPVINFSEHFRITLKYTHRPIHQLETCYIQRLTKSDISATSGSSNLKPTFSLLPKFLQKTANSFCAELCQLFIDTFWRRREGRIKNRT